MEANVKPGTRCECRERWSHTFGGSLCKGDHVYPPDSVGSTYEPHQCRNEAVRMVTIYTYTEPPHEGYDRYYPVGIPMCAPCAACHEARQKERA